MMDEKPKNDGVMARMRQGCPSIFPANAGGPEAMKESPGEEGGRLRPAAGNGVGRNFIPARERLFSPGKTAGKAPT
ncbi:hypothetical protein [Acidithiobacillus sulfuriphilus]|uniref:hypothetical protein n=1 Tax=Acidithiobacillus sulfuriphilus TaxID=1867749 RepID=UPI003F61FD84